MDSQSLCSFRSSRAWAFAWPRVTPRGDAQVCVPPAVESRAFAWVSSGGHPGGGVTWCIPRTKSHRSVFSPRPQWSHAVHLLVAYVALLPVREEGLHACGKSGPPILPVLSCITTKYTSATSQVCASVISNIVTHLVGRVVVLSVASLWACVHLTIRSRVHDR
jgi:hypothetical protein